MKSKKVNKDFDPEFGADFRTSNSEELKSEMISLMEMRLARMKALPAEEVAKAKLLQLKYLIEDFLNKQVNDEKNYFSLFLSIYIDSLYRKRAEFASDLKISGSSLSHVLNSHREPSGEFLLKLVAHSKIVYSHVSGFESNNWVNVYYHEKACDLLSQENEKELNISVSALL